MPDEPINALCTPPVLDVIGLSIPLTNWAATLAGTTTR